MKFVAPKIYMIGETSLIKENVQNFLDYIGAPDWSTDSPSDAEKLIELSGKTCYMSFNTDLNKNLTRVRQNQNKEYIKNLIDVNHGSVLEHATVTFAICNVSRIFTHELVRHRAGTAFSQESGRYVRTDEVRAYKPEALTDEENILLEEALCNIEILYKDLESKVFERVGNDFDTKKKVTSAIRRILPNGQTNTIIFTANHRALRHIVNMRTHPSAEEEIQVVFKEIGEQLKWKYPHIYDDLFTSN